MQTFWAFTVLCLPHWKIRWIIDVAFIWILQELLHLSSEKIDPELYVWSCIWRHRGTKEEVTDWNQSAVLFKSQKSCCLCQMFQSVTKSIRFEQRQRLAVFFWKICVDIEVPLPRIIPPYFHSPSLSLFFNYINDIIINLFFYLYTVCWLLTLEEVSPLLHGHWSHHV